MVACPPGLPGRLLCLIVSLPGGTFVTAQILRPRWRRHLPIAFAALSKERVPENRFVSWLEPLRCDPEVRRDLAKYLRGVPTRTQPLKWAERQRAFSGQVLVVWTRQDKLMPPEHAERLAVEFQDAKLVRFDDSTEVDPLSWTVLNSVVAVHLPCLHWEMTRNEPRWTPDPRLLRHPTQSVYESERPNRVGTPRENEENNTGQATDGGGQGTPSKLRKKRPCLRPSAKRLLRCRFMA